MPIGFKHAGKVPEQGGSEDVDILYHTPVAGCWLRGKLGLLLVIVSISMMSHGTDCKIQTGEHRDFQGCPKAMH